MAVPGLGAKAWIGLAEESTWGTGVGATDFCRIAGGESLKTNQTYFPSPALDGAAIKKIHQGTMNAMGDIPLPATYEGVELLLKHGLGAVSSAVSGDGYKHTFTPDDDLPTGLSLELYRGMPATKSFVAVGCKISKLVFGLEANKPLMITASFLGKDVTTPNKTTPTFPTADEILFSEHVLTTATFTGAVDALSLQFEINNPLTEGRFDLADGGAFKEPQRSDKRTVLGTFEGEFSDEAQYTDWTGGVEGTITSTFTGAIFAGSTNYEFKTTLNCIFTARQPQVADAGPVRLSGTIQGWEDGSTPEIKIEVTNSITSI